MRRDAAFAFKSDLRLRQQLERLNARGPFTWSERDCHWYPDFISARTHRDRGFFKIFDDPEHARFVLNIELESERPSLDAEFAELVSLARDHVLPSLEARDVEETEPFD